ncbi:MAG: SIMPL domain-containing protein [Candidatus Nucleicultricaceae bacterium]|jgi:hypothetical protein
MESKRPVGLMCLLIAVLSLGTIVYITRELTERFLVERTSIEVKGYAEKKIVSDFAVWSGRFVVRHANMTDAYRLIEEDRTKVLDFLKKNGIDHDDITFNPLSIFPQYKLSDTGASTNVVESYEASLEFKVASSDTDKIFKISRDSNDLVGQGVQFSSFPPNFIYTKIDEVKVELLEEAAKDAYKRADHLADSSDVSLNKLKSIRQGVFQITPEYNFDISDSGYYDTSTINKTVKAVVTATYTLK